jgi:hypothetical protein
LPSISVPLVAAGVGAAGAIGSAAINSSAASNAADTASNTAASNNALVTSLYNQNSANLSPYIASGDAAGTEINGLLGLTPTSTTAANGLSGSSGASGFNASAYLASNPDVASAASQAVGHVYDPTTGKLFQSADEYAQYHYDAFGEAEDRSPTGTTAATTTAAAAPAGSTAGSSTNNSNAALQTYLNSSDYQFTYGQGLEATQQAKATQGLLNSGANLKATETYGQNEAQSAIGTYLSALQSQQATGLSGANALAGVSTNYGNTVSSNNNSAASVSANAGIAAASNTTSALSSTLQSALNAYGTNATSGTSYAPSVSGVTSDLSGLGLG